MTSIDEAIDHIETAIQPIIDNKPALERAATIRLIRIAQRLAGVVLDKGTLGLDHLGVVEPLKKLTEYGVFFKRS